MKKGKILSVNISMTRIPTMKFGEALSSQQNTIASSGIHWYWRRASVMSLSECWSRLAEPVTISSIRLLDGLGLFTQNMKSYVPQAYSFCRGKTSQLPILPWGFDIYQQGLRNTSHQKQILKDLENELLNFPNWHLAPDSNKVWPMKFYRNISYHSGNLIGDVRISWETSRLQHFICLGLLTKNLEGELPFSPAKVLEEQLFSWLKANPFLHGIHYISAMECALRILSVCFGVDLAREKLQSPEQTWQAVLYLVESHAKFIVHRISSHSSTGNHTIAEASALVYAGCLFPEMKGAEAWYSQGISILEREASRQILEDGGGIEQSIWYQLFITDLYGLVVSLLKEKEEFLPTSIKDGFIRGKAFLNAFGSSAKELPSIGDCDDGRALSQYLELSFSNNKSLTKCVNLQNSGYSLLHGKEDIQLSLIFDHGSLGMPPCYGHGHADALSVLLKVEKDDVLIDPGTYTYNGALLWRKYFRGTSAHNTVTINDEDQAKQETPFLWSSPFSTEIIHQKKGEGEIDIILARHTGYLHRFGIIHWRGILSSSSHNMWWIWDCITGTGNHSLSLHWHLGNAPTVTENGFSIPGSTHLVYLSVRGGTVALCSGETNPILGWRSKQYDQKEPSSTIRVAFHGSLPHEFLTQIFINKASEVMYDEPKELELLRKLVCEKSSN